MQCPSCRKSVDDLPVCPRCSCDMGVLLMLRSHAQAFTQHAMGLLRAGDYPEALAAARKGFALCGSAPAARCVALACLALRDYPSAVTWRRVAMDSENSMESGGYQK